MSDPIDEEKDKNSMKKIFVAVGLAATVAVAATGLATAGLPAASKDKRPSKYAEILKSDQSLKICADEKAPPAAKARAGQCQEDKNGKRWWVTCHGKYIDPRCFKKDGKQ